MWKLDNLNNFQYAYQGLLSSAYILGGSNSNSFSLSSEMSDDIMRSSSVTVLLLLGNKPILENKGKG